MNTVARGKMVLREEEIKKAEVVDSQMNMEMNTLMEGIKKIIINLKKLKLRKKLLMKGAKKRLKK